MEKYKAAFIVPKGAEKKLEDVGWEFRSSSYISKEIREHFIEELNLSLIESDLGIDRYENHNIKMSVVLSETKEIENIYFQLKNDSLSKLKMVFQIGDISEQCELFVPE